jgi:hypothetical protein
MTLVASILFLSALAASAFAIAVTIGNALPRIRDVIEAEFGPTVTIERRVNFGPVRHLGAALKANVVPFPMAARVEQEFKLAA